MTFALFGENASVFRGISSEYVHKQALDDVLSDLPFGTCKSTKYKIVLFYSHLFDNKTSIFENRDRSNVLSS